MPLKQKILTVVFLATVGVSATSLVISTLNYTQFYTAIRRLDLAVLDVSPTIGEDSLSVTLIFAITNNSSYTGLNVRELSYTLNFEHDMERVRILSDTKSYYSEPVRLGPYSNTTFEYVTTLGVNQEPAQRFIEFYKNKQGYITWILTCNVIFLTFIGTVYIPLTTLFLQEHS